MVLILLTLACTIIDLVPYMEHDAQAHAAKEKSVVLLRGNTPLFSFAAMCKLLMPTVSTRLVVITNLENANMLAFAVQQCVRRPHECILMCCPLYIQKMAHMNAF